MSAISLRLPESLHKKAKRYLPLVRRLFGGTSARESLRGSLCRFRHFERDTIMKKININCKKNLAL